MNKKFFKDNITVFHNNDDGTYKRYPFQKVYFRENKKINVIDKGQEGASSVSITIPTEKELNICEGDFIVRDIIKGTFDISKIIKSHKVYKILSIDDYRKGGLPHYKIGAKE